MFHGGVVPLDEGPVVDVRVRRAFGRGSGRIDALNLAGERWDAVGFVTPDLEGRPVPHVFPGMGRALRAGLEIAF